MKVRQTITNLYKNPKQLFVIDAVGAMLSSILIGIVLVKLEYLFGIPVSTLHLLAAIPLLFIIFDLYSYNKGKNKLGELLKSIAVMNLLYCYLSIGLAFFHHQTITGLGWVYFITETMIITGLVALELNVAKNCLSHNNK